VIVIGPELLSRGIDMLFFGFRKVEYRPRNPIKWDGIAEVVSALSIPLIANGDVFEYSDFSVHQRCNS